MNPEKWAYWNRFDLVLIVVSDNKYFHFFIRDGLLSFVKNNLLPLSIGL